MPYRAVLVFALAALSFAGCSGGGSGAGSTIPASPAVIASAATPAPPSSSSTTAKTSILTVSLPTTIGASVPTVALPTSSGATSLTITVNESAYSGTFSIDGSKCAGIAAFTAVSPNGPSATFSVTQQGAGNCGAVVSDANGNSATLDVGSTVTTATVAIPPKNPIQVATSLALPVPATPPATGYVPFATLAVSESGYGGVFTVSSAACAGIVSVSPVSANGPSASFTVTQIGPGICTLTVTDLQGQSATVNVGSTTTTGIAS